jgi:hypothetical protein
VIAGATSDCEVGLDRKNPVPTVIDGTIVESGQEWLQSAGFSIKLDRKVLGCCHEQLGSLDGTVINDIA